MPPHTPPSTLRRSCRRLGSAIVVALVALALRTPAAHADEFDTALAQYKAMLKRPSLYKRTQGRIRFAGTGLLRAIPTLVEDYLHPEEPKDQVRYLIATIATEKFASTKEAAPVLAEWRGKAREPIDGWLWFRALEAERALDSTSAVDVAKKGDQLPLFRAAAIRALVRREDSETRAVVAEVLDHLPDAQPAREMLLEACAAAARTWGSHVKDEATRTIVEKIARVLDDEKVSLDTRDIVARNLASLFQTDVLGPGSGPYLRELAAAAERAENAAPPEVQYAPGPFFGLRAIGHRVVFVIDASDSMLEPLTPGEQKKMKVVTSGDGPPTKPGSKPTAPKPDAPEPLPWERIKCRFDAAREVLKRSLRALKSDQSFCVILFGSDAKTIPSTQGLKSVDAKTIEAAVADLDRMKAEPAPGDKSRPYGKLRGETNLHGGIRLAFRVSTGKSFGPGEYVDRSRTGCDAIYVLSDGVPSTDDFRKEDKRDDEKTVKDRETMTPVKDTPTLTFTGPYGYPTFESFDYISDDVMRLNLFRQAEIHCVAIGEADDAIMRRIADIGTGRFRRVGDGEDDSGK